MKKFIEVAYGVARSTILVAALTAIIDQIIDGDLEDLFFEDTVSRNALMVVAFVVMTIASIVKTVYAAKVKDRE